LLKIIKNYFNSFALKINDKILEEKLSNFQQNNVNEIYALNLCFNWRRTNNSKRIFEKSVS